MTEEDIKETFRRATILTRHHLDLLAAEQAITKQELTRIVSSNQISISQISPNEANISARSKWFKSKTTYNEIVKAVLGGIIKTIKEYEPLKDELGYLNKEFKEDNESKLFNDLCIATFVIRNQAITKLYGKEIGSKIEEHCLNICLKAFNQNSILLYEELKQIWLFSFDLDLVPHLEVCKKLYHRTCNRINQEYTENPLAEIALADLIINSQCGIWLRMSKAFKLIEDKQ